MDDFMVKAMQVNNVFSPLLNLRTEKSYNDNKEKIHALNVFVKLKDLLEAQEKLQSILENSRKWLLSIGFNDAGDKFVNYIKLLVKEIWSNFLSTVVELNDPYTENDRIEIMLKYKDDFLRESKKCFDDFMKITNTFRDFVNGNKWQGIDLFKEQHSVTELPPEELLLNSLIEIGVVTQNINPSVTYTSCINNKNPFKAFLKVMEYLKESKPWLWKTFGPEISVNIQGNIIKVIGKILMYHSMNFSKQLDSIPKYKMSSDVTLKMNAIEKKLPEKQNLEQELHKIVTQLQTALKPQHELATKNTQEPEETNKTDNKRGRKKKYTPELLQSMQNTFDEHIKKLDTKGAWNKVADIFGIPSGKAAEMACKRAKNVTNNI